MTAQPRHRWIAKLVDDFEHNPDFQVKFHLAMMLFWIANGIVGTIVLVFLPRLWVSIGVFYVFLLSIYANWDTDYDACSAASAFKHAKSVDDKRADQ